MGIVRSYKDLNVWQRAVDFSVAIYRETALFPKSEIYGPTHQLRRASVSVPSNIAEGHAHSRKDYGRFLTIALGSFAEVETQLEIARRINYLSQEKYDLLIDDLTIIGKQLNNLYQKIRA